MSSRTPENGGRAVIFLGGIFTPNQIGMIQSKSIGVVQNAADALQKNFIHGISLACPGKVSVVNLPYVNSCPRGFKLAYFPRTEETIFSDVFVNGQAFITIQFIKSFSRAWSALSGLFRVDSTRKSTIVIYAAHNPFLVASILYRCLFAPQSRICLILPDLPEFMGEGGILYKIVTFVNSTIFYRLARYIDAFVLLTEPMAERLRLSDDKYIVVEGVADTTGFGNVNHPDNETRPCSFLYTGTLAARYGIMELVHAFTKIRDQEVELWICGDGDCKAQISEWVHRDPRIRFFGQISRDEARALQQRASVLVNPRRPHGEFTRYSFPSKTLEYMAAGRPVLMHRLAGIPEDYLPYIVQPATADVDGFSRAMATLAKLPASELDRMGHSARKFVDQNKTEAQQGRRVAQLIANLK